MIYYIASVSQGLLVLFSAGAVVSAFASLYFLDPCGGDNKKMGIILVAAAFILATSVVFTPSSNTVLQMAAP